MRARPPSVTLSMFPLPCKSSSQALDAAAGKTTTAQGVAEAAGLRYINVGDRVKEQHLHSGFDEEHEAFIIDEDKVGPMPGGVQSWTH